VLLAPIWPAPPRAVLRSPALTAAAACAPRRTRSSTPPRAHPRHVRARRAPPQRVWPGQPGAQEGTHRQADGREQGLRARVHHPQPAGVRCRALLALLGRPACGAAAAAAARAKTAREQPSAWRSSRCSWRSRTPCCCTRRAPRTRARVCAGAASVSFRRTRHVVWVSMRGRRWARASPTHARTHMRARTRAHQRRAPAAHRCCRDGRLADRLEQAAQLVKAAYSECPSYDVVRRARPSAARALAAVCGDSGVVSCVRQLAACMR
jgi:hypothetical protein